MTNYLIVHAEREYSKNKFEDYCLTGLRAKDMYLSQKGLDDIENSVPSFKDLKLNKVLHNPNSSSEQTAIEFSKKLQIPSFPDNSLTSIKYDFSQFTNYKLWKNGLPNNQEMSSLREKALIFFLEDKLLESKEDIVGRFKKLEKILQENSDLLIISQAFYLKMFYLFLETRLEATALDLIKLMETDDYLYKPLSGFDYPNLTKFNYD